MTTAPRCRNCGSSFCLVVESTVHEMLGRKVSRQRRACQHCGTVFTTTATVEDSREGEPAAPCVSFANLLGNPYV